MKDYFRALNGVSNILKRLILGAKRMEFLSKFTGVHFSERAKRIPVV